MPQFRKHGPRFQRAPKTARTDADGITFDSKSEMKRWQELCLLQRAGEISNLRRQVEYPITIDGKPVLIRSEGFPNGRPAIYTADHVYIDKAGTEIVEEYKAFDDAASRFRRAVVEAIHGIEIVVTGAAARKTPRKSG